MKSVIIAAAALVASAAALPASAAPRPGNPVVDTPNPVVQVQGYHKECYWTGKGWGYKHGAKVLVCRPYRPHGSGWYWYSQGGKHGWYHKKHGWHHKW